MIKIKEATHDDFPFLKMLEETSFEASRRFTTKSLKHSLQSARQSVYILNSDHTDVAAAIVYHYEKSMRIYSIAVLPAYRGLSLGKYLLDYIINVAKEKKCIHISLEADAKNMALIEWYESFGFRLKHEIKDYYGNGEPAYKMGLVLAEKPRIKKQVANIVVVDQSIEWLENIETIDVVRAESFINDEKHQSAKALRVFNLCTSYDYQSTGYYVSLLAAARNQRAIPNVTTIKDFADTVIIQSIGEEVFELIQRSLKSIKADLFSLNVYFGMTDIKKYIKLAKALYRLFEAPLLEFTFEKGREWNLKRVVPLALSEIEVTDAVQASAKVYFSQKRFMVTRFKDYKYDLAILIDPEELTAPSCKIALSKFKHAADKIGFYTEFITKDDYHRVGEFDALFIRMTTNVNDYSYQFSRYAYAEGLVVIDDPWSILKCSNKLYFAESMKTVGILTPPSVLVSYHTTLSEILSQLCFPIILKQPDSAFSLGVFKVHNETELLERLRVLFESSELVVAQAFIPSTFDWRIGVLDNVPLYACKYYMAKNHWQIYNWSSTSRRNQFGLVDTMPIDAVPKTVIDTAVKAASSMGDGFYGVDLKEIEGKVYVIEVNDNPSVDYGWEDKVLQDELYLRVMQNIFTRIETARNIKRRVSQTH